MHQDLKKLSETLADSLRLYKNPLDHVQDAYASILFYVIYIRPFDFALHRGIVLFFAVLHVNALRWTPSGDEGRWGVGNRARMTGTFSPHRHSRRILDRPAAFTSLR